MSESELDIGGTGGSYKGLRHRVTKPCVALYFFHRGADAGLQLQAGTENDRDVELPEYFLANFG